MSDLNSFVEGVSNRRASVSLQTFTAAVIAGAIAGKNPSQVASDLGMALASFNQRLVSLRKLAKNEGVEVPALADGRTGNSGRTSGGNVSMKNSVIEALRMAGTVVAQVGDETAKKA